MGFPPWITKYGRQKESNNPDVADLYQSPDVYVNGVPVVLYQTPALTGTTPTTSATVNLDEIYFAEGPEAAKAAQATLVKAGLLTQAAVNAGNAAAAQFSKEAAPSNPYPQGNVASNNIPGDKFAGSTAFPDSLVLTPKGTTLGDLIRKVTFPNHQIQANGGLTAQQIVTNLANWAQNIWEPLKAQFPDAFITNTFREGGGSSQHGTGQAGDIQFHKLPSSEYLARAHWMQANLPFDQLLLECHTNGSGALWIHVSHYSGTGINIHAKPAGNWAATMINDASFTPGLRDLAGLAGVAKVPAA